MEEKTMVNDILGNVKADLTAYQTAISESENIQLRQTFQQIRNNDESFQYELFKLAESKGYYVPAENSKPDEIQKVKNDFKEEMSTSNYNKRIKAYKAIFPIKIKTVKPKKENTENTSIIGKDNSVLQEDWKIPNYQLRKNIKIHHFAQNIDINIFKITLYHAV